VPPLGSRSGASSANASADATNHGSGGSAGAQHDDGAATRAGGGSDDDTLFGRS
jgi:hypothetical protein